MTGTFTEKQTDAMATDKSLSVTAGAGTGKTHVLVNRYIKLLKEGYYPHEILALTFTEKAAAEMKFRIRLGILSDPELKARESELSEEMMRAEISTFHSFCIRILREFSLEAGVDSAFSVLEESESKRIQEDVIEEFFNGDVSKDRELYDALKFCVVNAGSFNLRSILCELHEKRRNAAYLFNKFSENPEKYMAESSRLYERVTIDIIESLRRNRRFMDSLDTLIDIGASAGVSDDLAVLFLNNAGDDMRIFKEGSADEAYRALLHIEEIRKRIGVKSNSGKKALGNRYEDYNEAFTVFKEKCDKALVLLNEFAQGVSPEKAETAIAYLKRLKIIFERMEMRIASEKNKVCGEDFTDVIDKTHILFTEHPELVKSAISKRYRRIMIDEFQDTDPAQSQIIHMISDASGNKDSLFIVGDPKQSIYLFRDADVSGFKHFSDVITTEKSGSSVSLDVNFRSAPDVINFVNILFGKLFAETPHDWDFRYDSLKADRNDIKGSVELLLSKIPDKKEKGIASKKYLIESCAAARRIRMIAEEGINGVKYGYGSIAVLIRSRTPLKYLEYSLKKYSVPYTVAGGIGFYEKQEIHDCISFFSVMKNPADEISLYGLLRSPWFGFADSELFRIKYGQNETLFECMKKYAVTDEPSAEKVKYAVELIESWHISSARMPLSHLFEKALIESKVYSVYSGIFNGRQCIANIEKLAGIIRSREGRGYYTLSRLLDDLNGSRESGEKSGEGADTEYTCDSVTIMTVHASKGLEFPVVVLPFLSSGEHNDSAQICIDDEFGLGVDLKAFNEEKSDNKKNYNSPHLAAYNYFHNLKSRSEAKRLFYVACTRARDCLVLSVSYSKKGTYSSDPDQQNNGADWIMHNLFRDYVPEKEEKNKINDEEKDSPFTLIPDGRYEISGDGFESAITVINQDSLPEYPESASSGISAGTDSAADDASEVYGASAAFGTQTSLKIQASGVETMVFSPSLIGRYCDMIHEDIEETEIYGFSDIFNRNEYALFGTIVHEALAGAGNEALTERYGEDYVKSADKIDEICRKFFSSDLIKSASAHECELKFETEIAGYRFSGSIDRLIKSGDKWIIVDYKTGSPKESYDMQLFIYHEAVRTIMNADADTYIYYTKTGEFVRRIIDAEMMTGKIAELCRKILDERGADDRL